MRCYVCYINTMSADGLALKGAFVFADAVLINTNLYIYRTSTMRVKIILNSFRQSDTYMRQ